MVLLDLGGEILFGIFPLLTLGGTLVTWVYGWQFWKRKRKTLAVVLYVIGAASLVFFFMYLSLILSDWEVG